MLVVSRTWSIIYANFTRLILVQDDLCFPPRFRIRPVIHSDNFMQKKYATFDVFSIGDLQSVFYKADTLLCLHLSFVFVSIPVDHWINKPRHKHFAASSSTLMSLLVASTLKYHLTSQLCLALAILYNETFSIDLKSHKACFI